MTAAATERETTRLLRELVRRPSVNPMGRDLQGPDLYEHRVADFVEEFFRGLGVRCERRQVAPLRDNVIAFSDIPSARATLLFEAHQDTVPIDQMTIDPFGARIENGRLFGRGACDIKGGMAAMLAAFARLVRERPQGAANVIMACTVDEEHTFIGVTHLMKSGVRADAAVVAEPTQLKIVHAHKGVIRWHIDARGRSCHSSSPERGENAIYRMGHLLTAIESYAGQLRASRVDPVLGPPTLSVGRIEGGTSVNTVPDRCRIEIDRRLITGEISESAPADLHAFLTASTGMTFPFETSAPWLRCPALSPAGSDVIVARLAEAIDAVQRAHEICAVPYGTDASTIAEYGVPAVVFGPGDIAQAHTCDEWVPLDEVESAAEILFGLTKRFTS